MVSELWKSHPDANTMDGKYGTCTHSISSARTFLKYLSIAFPVDCLALPLANSLSFVPCTLSSPMYSGNCLPAIRHRMIPASGRIHVREFPLPLPLLVQSSVAGTLPISWNGLAACATRSSIDILLKY